jgi:hypothetical protein
LDPLAIKEALTNRPFRPFVLRSGDGREYPVKGPETMLIMPRGRTVIIVSGGHEFDVIDTFLISSMHDGARSGGAGKRNGRNGR